jgi:hypothetical protein
MKTPVRDQVNRMDAVDYFTLLAQLMKTNPPTQADGPDTALTTFFRILGENKVATEDLDAKLREVAARHLTLLKQAEGSADDDPQVAAIKTEAVAAIGAGDYARAEGLLRHAFDADVAIARRAQDAAVAQRMLPATACSRQRRPRLTLANWT